MCKILNIAGIKPENNEAAWKFIKAMAKPMSVGQRDGLGYAAITAEGKLFGERWLDNSTAFKKELVKEPHDAIEGFAETLTTPTFEYNSYGDVVPELAVAITMHTRMATSPKGMMNTHPFVDEGVSLIHNGVIRNDENFKLKSTCDSEAILRAYLKEKVSNSLENVQAMATSLVGYYACGVLTNTKTGPIMDVFKGTGARLYAIYVKELDTYVFSTDDDDIKAVCNLLGFEIGTVYRVLPGKYIRLNATTGKRIDMVSFTEGYEWKPTYTPPTPPPPTNSGKTYLNTMSKSNLYELNKFKKDQNKNPSDNMKEYLTAGNATCVRLTDRQIQEEISLKTIFRS